MTETATNNTVVTFRYDGKDQASNINDLLDADVQGLEPNYGFTVTPAGTFHLRTKKAFMEIREMAESKGSSVRVNRAVYILEFEIMNVINLADSTVVEESLIGKPHNEMYTVFDFTDDTGKIVAIFEESGFIPTTYKIREMLNEFVGHEFLAVIKTRKDKNDPSKQYSNIDLRGIKPLSQAVEQPEEQPQSQPNPPSQPSQSHAFKLGS